jgi:hypothetical protein
MGEWLESQEERLESYKGREHSTNEAGYVMGGKDNEKEKKEAITHTLGCPTPVRDRKS